MEWEWKLKQYRTCVDPALDVILALLNGNLPPYLVTPMRQLGWDLQFFKMFCWGLGFPEELLDADGMLGFTLMVQKLGQFAEEIQMRFEAANEGEKITSLEPLGYRLSTMIQELRSQARDICYLLLDGGFLFTCKLSSQLEMSLTYKFRVEMEDFMCLIKENLDQLCVAQQEVALIQGHLELFAAFVKVLNEWPYGSYKSELLMRYIQIWSTHISCLIYLYFIEEYDEIPDSTLEALVSDVISCNPESMMLILDVFLAGERHKFQGTILSQFLADYIDLLLEHVIVQYPKDDVEKLREGLTFLLSFAMDRPDEDSQETKLIWAEIREIVSEVPSILCDPETKKLFDFLHMVDIIKLKVSDLYPVCSVSAQLNSPRTNAIGYLDSFLVELDNMLKGGVKFIPSVKSHVEGVHHGLASLRPILQHALEIQNEDGMLKDLQTEIVSLIHFATYVIKLCPIASFSVWYGIVCLPNVLLDISHVKRAMEKIEDDLHMYSSKKVTIETGSDNAFLPREATSKHERAFIGFKEDAGAILDKVLRGQKPLTIISISGMPGQGKTALAKRIFRDPSIRYRFDKTAWGYVGKECKLSKLFADILRFVRDGNDGDNAETNDLADSLRKSLKGRKYFLVLDDIWDVDMWGQVQALFPNDRNGSRILFTTRNHDLALQCKQNSVPHPLRLFSDEESLELIQDMCFDNGFPPYFLDVGREIAIHCKGLPLAVALIASHLKQIGRELDLWMEVAENLKAHLASEGCMHVLELSYNNLPTQIKPCFLYVGAFRRGTIFYARVLISHWIANGLVMRNGQEGCSENLAREYLDYLVSQNLVVVVQRGPMGTIKRCMVHDLIYDLCIQKCIEDNFLHMLDSDAVPKEYNKNHYWLYILESGPEFSHPISCVSIKQLPTSMVHSLTWGPSDSLLKTYSKSLYSFLSSFRVLTMLDMGCLTMSDSTIPEIIFTNIHLRYVTLIGKFCCIPRSIVRLWNLERLVLKMEDFLWLPKFLWEMKSLRWLRVIKSRLHLWSFQESLSSTAAASNIKRLGEIIIPYDVEIQEFLGSLPWLRELCCFYDTELHPEWLSMFGSLRKLETLKIDRHVSSDVDPVNHSWRNLRINFPDTLKKLSIWHTGIPWKSMSVIGKLPNLQVLKLSFDACKGSNWNLGDEEFPNLRYLKLYWMNLK